MTSPISPTFIPNFEFLEHYLDCMENVPLDVQRFITQLREYDLLYRTKLDQIGQFLSLYRNQQTGPGKRKFLNKIQKCFIKSQQYGDEKLNIISQIVELVETRNQQVARDAVNLDIDMKEEISRIATNGGSNSSNNHRMKLEKPPKPSMEKAKMLYEKPKRVRRVRTLEKIHDKVEKANSSSNANKDDIDEDEDEEVPEEEESDVKTRKDSKKKDKEKLRDKEKEKEKSKDEKEEKREDKKNERKEKSSGKVTKKTNIKQVSTKVKKKKKKDKESTPEDVPVDPDEPTYCVCNSISYGDMIGCDNDDCLIEWFHFGCVNLSHKPKGKWYCPGCTVERKEKGKK